MKRWIACVVSAVALGGGVGRAQTASQAGQPERWYAEAVAQSAFGNVTSQSYGGEVGVNLLPSLQVYGEGGRTRNVAPSQLGAAAQQIAGFLSETQTGVTFSTGEPAAFFDAGLRYLVAGRGNIQPYILAGAGVASVTRNVHFLIGGSDVTGSLQQYGVVLGNDLSGSSTDPLLVIGGGVTWFAWRQLELDLQYRYGRIFDSSGGINVSRVGLGVGVHF